MKKLLILAGIGLSITTAFSQVPNWQWAKNAGGSQHDGNTINWSGNNIKADSDGNIYVTGNFNSDTITFDNIVLYNDSAGSSEFFIAKYNSLGNVIWAKSFGGSKDEYNMDMDIDLSGNIILTGWFNSDSIKLGNVTLTNSGSFNNYSKLFIAKWDSAGNALWAKGVNEISNAGYGISIDHDGNTYITGEFYNPTITFDTITLINSENTGYTSDLFIVKYDSAGNAIWAKSFGGYNNNEIGIRICNDNTGNIYISGNYGNYVAFDSFILTNNSGNATNNNMFILKCNPSGNIMWAKGVYGSNPTAQSITVDADGQLYVLGNFTDYGITLNTVTLLNSGGLNNSFDIFIAQYDSLGLLNWAKSYGTGNGNDIAWDICIDESHNSYITGWFESSNINFDGINILNTNNSSPTQDIFIAKFDSACIALWAMSQGTVGSEAGNGICIDAFDNIFLTGYYADTSITFGSDVLFNHNTDNTLDIYVSKLSSIITNSSFGLSDIQNISVYPNPFTSQTTLTFTKEQKNTTIKIMGVLGEEIKIINFTGQHLTIEKGEMKEGIYFIQVVDHNKFVYNRKIIIQ
ncbi:MAG: hypothetical protein K0S44_1031 [Bacteroidetes bacterium]|jgi:hypothetical protein|nr:hypothetical protein [Bacteroidota bacterium]